MNAAPNRTRLFEMLDDGMLDAHSLARDLMGYMSDNDVKDFAEQNDIELFPEEEEEEAETFEFEDENDVRESFAEHWAERLRECPAYVNDKPAKGMAFTCFVDDLQRDGRISDDLADSVTMGD